MDENKSCKERVGENYKGRMADIRKLWTVYRAGEEDKYSDKLGTWNEYGLCFDYCPAGTWTDQKEGFFRFQLSTGGPGDEFRFYCDAAGVLVRVQYVFLDWGDGATITLRGSSADLLREIFEDWQECGTVSEALRRAGVDEDDLSAARG